MTTVTRTVTKSTVPAYKDYVNFLGTYKNTKTDDRIENTDNGVSVQNFPLLSSSTSTSSSSISTDTTDFSKNSSMSYNTFLENSKNNKFKPVNRQSSEEKPTKRSEIFIEIQPTKSVSEVSKIFENKQNRKSPPKSNTMNSKISIFEKQISTENKPKIFNKPKTKILTPPPRADTSPPTLKTVTPLPPNKSDAGAIPPPPPPPPSVTPIKVKEPVEVSLPLPPPPLILHETEESVDESLPPPPPPPLPLLEVPKMQATLNKGTKYTVNNPKGTSVNEIDRNDPMVRKLVYGTLRGLYGAYHDKANDFMATLPKNMVVKNNGVQDIIDKIASNGDLDKLNGRINPKSEQD